METNIAKRELAYRQTDQRNALAVGVLTNLIVSFLGSVMNLSTPDISSEFSVGAGTVSWFVTSYILASAVFSVPFGKYADLHGRKKILMLGLGLLSVTSGLIILPKSFGLLLVLRFIQGIGAAMIFATNVAIVSCAYPAGGRGKALGITISAAYIGQSAGPVLGGFLNHQMGWRSIQLFILAISLAALLSVLRKLPWDKRREDAGPMDFAGSILLVSSLVLLMYGFSSLGSGGAGKICLAAGALLLVMFIRYEFAISNPVINVRLFAENKGYMLSNFAAMLNYGATYMIAFVLPIYLQTVKGFDSQSAGFIMAAQPVVIALLAARIGRLSDRRCPFRLASLGMLLSAAGLLCFSFLRLDTSVAQIVFSLVLVGLGFSFFSSPNTNAIMSFVGEDQYGMASSVMAAMRAVGNTASMAGITLLLSLRLGNIQLAQAPPAEVVSAIGPAFLVFAAVCGVGVYLSASRRSVSHKEKKTAAPF